MTLPASGYLSDASRTEGEMKVALEDQRDAVAALEVGLVGLARVQGLIGNPNATTPATKYDLAAAGVLLRDPATGALFVHTAVAITNDLTVAPPTANGRDTAGALAAGFVHFYFVRAADGTVRTRSSNTAPPTGPALAADEVAWAYAGAVKYTAGALGKMRMRGALMSYDNWLDAAILTNGVATISTAVSITAVVPPNALTVLGTALIQGGASNAGNGIDTGFFNNGADPVVNGSIYGARVDTLSSTGAYRFSDNNAFEFPYVAGSFNYLVNRGSTGGTAPGLYLAVQGFRVANGDA
jgi:hypothetical protein